MNLLRRRAAWKEFVCFTSLISKLLDVIVIVMLSPDTTYVLRRTQVDHMRSNRYFHGFKMLFSLSLEICHVYMCFSYPLRSSIVCCLWSVRNQMMQIINSGTAISELFIKTMDARCSDLSFAFFSFAFPHSPLFIYDLLVFFLMRLYEWYCI